MKNTRNEVFNSKKLTLNINKVNNINNFTVKPIRGEDGNNQICVTFNKTTSNAISFFVSYRFKGTDVWLNSLTEKILNVINVKNLEPGVYEVRIVALSARQQTPSAIKEVEIKEQTPVTRVKNQNKSVSETILNIANNLADDIIANAFFNLSDNDSFYHYKSASTEHR